MTHGAAQNAARADLRGGVLVVPWEGLPRPVDPVADKLLQERHGIQMWALGDQIDGTSGALAEGYGGITSEEAKRCFGQNVFERAYAEAETMTFHFPDDWLNRDSVFEAIAEVARERGLRGRVFFSITPGTRGAFERVKVLHSESPALDSVALRLLRQARLRVLPEGAPMQQGFSMPVRFGPRPQ